MAVAAQAVALLAFLGVPELIGIIEEWLTYRRRAADTGALGVLNNPTDPEHLLIPKRQWFEWSFAGKGVPGLSPGLCCPGMPACRPASCGGRADGEQANAQSRRPENPKVSRKPPRP